MRDDKIYFLSLLLDSIKDIAYEGVLIADVMKTVNIADLKSAGRRPCGFKSRRPHHFVQFFSCFPVKNIAFCDLIAILFGYCDYMENESFFLMEKRFSCVL